MKRKKRERAVKVSVSFTPTELRQARRAMKARKARSLSAYFGYLIHLDSDV